MKVEWKEITEKDEWNGFVKGRASVFHSWGWREVIAGTGLEPLYLGAQSPNGNLVGICPLFYVKLKGPIYILDSIPHSDLSGPVFLEGANDGDSLIGSMIESLPRSFNKLVASVRLRVTDPILAEGLIHDGDNYSKGSGYFHLDLDRVTPETIWNQVFRRDERKKIRQLDQMNAETRLCSSPEDVLRFYELYGQTMEQRGYKTHPESFFWDIYKSFRDESKFLFVILDGKPVAVMSFILDRSLRSIHLQYVGYRMIRNRSPNFYAYWSAINWASKNGFRFVNFGNGSSDPRSSNFRFKQQFGGDFVTRYTFTMPVHRNLYRFSKSLKSRISG